MSRSLKWKLVFGFVAVIAITGLFSTLIGVHLIGKLIVKGGRSKVSLDLNSARQIYHQRLKNIRTVLTFTALRRFAVKEAFLSGDRQLLLQALLRASTEGQLDFLTLTDHTGQVVIRAHNPNIHGDNRSSDPFVNRVIRSRQALAHTETVGKEVLNRENPALVRKARILVKPTLRSRPSTRKVSTAGMVLKAAVPLLGDQGELLGVLYGGILLNRNYKIVDAIKNVVYRGMSRNGKDVGSATIFMSDLRISTNVRLKNGKRAVGTRVSAEVYDTVIGKGRTWTTRAFVVNEWYLTAYAPIRNMGGRAIGMLYVGMLEKKYSDMKASAFWIFVGVTGGGGVLALAVAVLLSLSVLNPVHRLTRAVEALETGDYEFQVEVRSRDEIGRLANAFGRMRSELRDTYSKLRGKIEAADEDLKRAYRVLKEKQAQLVQTEKLASMGQLSAGVAHEINNPLGTILLLAHALLRDNNTDPALRADIELVANEATRCREIVRGLLDFARQSRLAPEKADVAKIIDDVVTLMSVNTRGTDVSLSSDIAENLPRMMIDPVQIKQVLVNLVANGLDALNGKGEVRISATPAKDGRVVLIEVADSGCGIPPAHLGRLFTPFFTTKEEGKGTGLGLAVAYGIIKMHRGDITVTSRQGEGTTFTVQLPVADGGHKREGDPDNGTTTTDHCDC